MTNPDEFDPEMTHAPLEPTAGRDIGSDQPNTSTPSLPDDAERVNGLAGRNAPAADHAIGHLDASSVDLNHLRRAAELFLAMGRVVEMRVLGYRGRHTLIGWFDAVDAVVCKAEEVSGQASGVYITLNPVQPSLLTRAPNGLRRANRDEGTTDGDIVRRCWLLIDCDAIRRAGTNSTDAEHQAAIERAQQIRPLLANLGIPSVLADSGNGAHLLVPIDLPNDDDALRLIKQILATLAARFDDATVKVDQKVSNASRICKLYGTLARKGEAMRERPHRIARLLDVPQNLEAVARPELERLLTTLGASAHPSTSAMTDGGSPHGFVVRANFELPDAITSGARDNTLTAFAGKLRYSGLEYSEILGALQQANGHCDEPLPDQDLQRIARSICRYEKGDLKPLTGSGDPLTPTATARRYALMSLTDLVKQRPPAYLIDHTLVCGCFAEIYGRQGSFKSFIVLAWALCVAAGRDWLGRRTVPGYVVYISGEGQGGLLRRVLAWCKHHDEDLPARFHLIGEGVHFLEPGGTAAFLDAMGVLPEPPVLIVVDTLARSFAGGDENSTQDMSAFIAALDAVRQATKATVVVVHHENRQGKARGNISLDGAVDAQFHVKQDVGLKVTVTAEKIKDGSQETAGFRLAGSEVDVTAEMRAIIVANGDDPDDPDLNFPEDWTSLVFGPEASTAGMVEEHKHARRMALLLAQQGSATDTAWKKTCADNGIAKNAYYEGKGWLVRHGWVCDDGTDRAHGKRFTVTAVGHRQISPESQVGPGLVPGLTNTGQGQGSTKGLDWSCQSHTRKGGTTDQPNPSDRHSCADGFSSPSRDGVLAGGTGLSGATGSIDLNRRRAAIARIGEQHGWPPLSFTDVGHGETTWREALAHAALPELRRLHHAARSVRRHSGAFFYRMAINEIGAELDFPEIDQFWLDAGFEAWKKYAWNADHADLARMLSAAIEVRRKENEQVIAIDPEAEQKYREALRPCEVAGCGDIGLDRSVPCSTQTIVLCAEHRDGRRHLLGQAAYYGYPEGGLDAWVEFIRRADECLIDLAGTCLEEREESVRWRADQTELFRRWQEVGELQRAGLLAPIPEDAVLVLVGYEGAEETIDGEVE